MDGTLASTSRRRDMDHETAEPPEDTSGERRRRRRRRFVLLATGVPLGLAAGFVAVKALTWPDVAALARENPATTAFVERANRRDPSLHARLRWVPYARISPHLKRAVLVSEDINFFSHKGFELGELKQAVTEALEDKEAPRGASTLTQQLAKNLWLSPSRNPLRKLEEALLTAQLERHLDKRRIFELYLNVAEFGPGIFGAEAAARRYFGLAAADLGERQAAELAAGLPRPSSWHPGSTSRVYRRRVERTLSRMARAQWLWKVL